MTQHLNGRDRPVPPEELLFDIRMALTKAERVWPRRRLPGDHDQLMPAAREVAAHLELCGIRCFRRPPKERHSAPAPAPTAGATGHRTRDGERTMGTVQWERERFRRKSGKPPKSRRIKSPLTSDRAAAREVSGLALEAVRVRALDRWFSEERPLHEVSFHGFNNGYEAETDAWVQWQIQRQRRP